MPPPMSYPTPAQRGPTQLGARQAEHLQRLRQARDAQQGFQARNSKRSKKGGIYAAELVTDFEEAMDEAYDRLLGRRGRHQGRQDSDRSEDSDESDANPEGLAPFKVPASRFRG